MFSNVLLAVTLLAATSNLNMLKVALDPNPALKSYVASAQLAVTLHRGLAVHKTFTGTDDYTKPDEKIVFDNTSGPLSRFRELTTTLPTQTEILRDYVLDTQSDNGSHSQFVMDRKATDARVRSMAFTVDDKTKLLSNVLWTYADGSTLSISPAYESVGRYQLPSQETIRAAFRGYRVDGLLTLSDYRSLNPAP